MGSLTPGEIVVALTWLSALVQGEIGGDGGCWGSACLGLVGGCMLKGWKCSDTCRKLSRGACSGGDIMLLIASGFFACILEDGTEAAEIWPVIVWAELIDAYW